MGKLMEFVNETDYELFVLLDDELTERIDLIEVLCELMDYDIISRLRRNFFDSLVIITDTKQFCLDVYFEKTVLAIDAERIDNLTFQEALKVVQKLI